MSFFSQLIELFESLFHGSSPEVRQKQDLRKIETELRNLQPAIYKSKQILPNFAEVFRIFQENIIPLKKIFEETIANPNIRIREKYIGLLIETGFSDKSKDILESLEYENRKKEFFGDISAKRVHESQRKKIDILLKELNSGSFSLIERTLQNLDVLSDICNFSFTSLLREFNPDYRAGSIEQTGTFMAVPLEILEQYLTDFYFLTAHFTIDAALGRAVIALYVAKSPDILSEKDQNQILTHLRKIFSIMKKVLTPTNLKNLICLIKNDPLYEPKSSTNQENLIFKYADKIKHTFETDTQRIDVEVQDEHLQQEVSKLFGDTELDLLNGYNQENSKIFFRSGAGSFLWVTPLQILKNFITKFYDNKVNGLLNDLVVEGFFNNPQYKTDFSSRVFACSESGKRIIEFEESFEREGKNNIALMTGYLHDSHKDQTFMKSLASMISTVNVEAKNLIQKETSNFFLLSKNLAELIPDVRRTAPEYIENIRILFTSPRNKDSFEFLETTFPMWNIFLDIMRNYAIIGDVRDEQIHGK